MLDYGKSSEGDIDTLKSFTEVDMKDWRNFAIT